LSYCYASKQDDENITRALSLLNQSYDNDYPPINIFLNRGDKVYHQGGRWQTKKEAMGVDDLIKEKLSSFYGEFCLCNYGDIDSVIRYVESNLTR
jgi:hypothetical protein